MCYTDYITWEGGNASMAGNNHMSIRQVELNGISPGLKRVLKGTMAIQREALAYLCGVSMDH